MKKTLLLAALAIASIASAQAAESNVYVGASVGVSHSDYHAASDQTEGSGSLTVGYQINQRYAAEVSYGYLGNMTLDTGASAQQHSVAVQGVARMPVANKVEAFAKAGFAYTKLDDGAESHRWAPTVGVGADYALTRQVALRAEVQYTPDFAGTHANVTNTSIGAIYKF